MRLPTLIRASAVLALLVALLAVPPLSTAAVFTTMQFEATAAVNGSPMTVNDKGTVGVAVTGTFTGTVTFEGSTNANTTWSSVNCTTIDTLVTATTTTTTGQFTCNTAGFTGFRARISSYIDGSITVTGFPTAVGGGGGTGGGGSINGIVSISQVTPGTTNGVSIDQTTPGTTNGVAITTLGAGEDQPNNALATEGANVRQTTMWTGITTNTTSVTNIAPTGPKTFYGQVVCSSGACVQTQAIYGDIDSDAANGVLLCTLTLTATTRDQAACSVSSAPYSFYYVITTATSGTAASGAITAMY